MQIVRRFLRGRTIVWVGTAMLVVAAAGASAQSTDAGRIAELERKLERSLRLIEELSAKVQQLEQSAARADSGKGVSEAVARQEARISELQHHVSQLGTGLSARAGGETGLPIHGFADVAYVHSGRSNPSASGPKGFGVGSFDLYLTPQIGDRIKSLVELIFEVEEDGSLFTDLERLQIGYTFSDAATLWFGRFHTPYGYYNTAYHHGAQIQTAILRPRFLDFEDKGGILPAHTVGAWLTGSLPVGGGKFGYDLFVGNGPRIVIDGAKPGVVGSLDPNAGHDDNHQAMTGGNLSYRPGRVDGLKLGLHWMRGDVRDDTAAANRTRFQLLGPYVAYVTDDWEVLAEYFHFRNRDLSGATGSHRSNAWFAQVGRNFGSWTPFGRIERTSLDQADQYFARQDSGRSYRRAALGLRYDLDAKAAFKAEYLRTRMMDIPTAAGTTVDDRYGELRFQYSIRF